MGMFIRVTNSCLATHHVQYVIPQHVCGMYGKLPNESFGRALAKLFPHACSFKAGDPVDPAVLRIDGAKFTAGERELIEGLPLRPTLDQFWEHLNAPRKARINKILAKIKAALQLKELLWVQVDEGEILLRTTQWYADALPITVKKLRKLLRKDELKLVMAGELDYTNVNLRPF